jgi:glycosyltransferase involved in cell wall biosynthesis
MKMLIDARPLFKNRFSLGNKRYIIHCLTLLTREKPQVEFCFLTDEFPGEKNESPAFGNNTIIKKSFPGSLGAKLWRDWQIPALIKKNKPGLLLMTGGIASNRTAIPQCVWIPSVPVNKNYWSSVQQKLKNTARVAQVLFTDSEKKREWLIDQVPWAAEKIKIIHPAADEDHQPLSWQEKENTKVKYAGGREYFLSIQSYLQLNGFTDLLKAFSQFKKRQQSNMQLILITDTYSAEMDEKFETYKYRSDVHIHQIPEGKERVKIMAAAYAFFEPGDDHTAVLNAFRSQVSVIAGPDCSPEIAGDAVLYADSANHEELAGQLMLLYKDENLRAQLIEKGKVLEQQFSWERSAMQLWDGMMEALR